MTSTVRRSVAVLALAAALGTAACGASTADRAAVVDGTVIRETDLQAAMSEINGMDPALLQEQLTPTGTLTALVQAPVVLDYLAGKGVVVSDSVASREAADRGVAEPSEGTLQVIKFASAISAAQESGQLTDADGQALSEQLRSQDVDVNPRYGAFDPDTASIQLGQPSWVEAFDAGQ